MPFDKFRPSAELDDEVDAPPVPVVAVPEPAPPVAPSGPALSPALESVLNQWFVDTFHNRGFEVELSNAFTKSLDNLKQKIAAVMAGKDV